MVEMNHYLQCSQNRVVCKLKTFFSKEKTNGIAGFGDLNFFLNCLS
jgi:hypothetical protein